MNRENLPIVVSCPGTSTGDRMLAMINAIYVARFFIYLLNLFGLFLIKIIIL